MTTTVRTTKITRHLVEHQPDKDAEAMEFETTHAPADWLGDNPVVKKRSDGCWVVGYLVHDDDCESPLESCDSMGKIYTRHRHAGQESHRGFREAVGLDEYWNKTRKPNPNAVLLDCYDHGGQSWAISGSEQARMFPYQQWDVAHGGGVWVPDKDCLENIWRSTARALLPTGVELGWHPYRSGHKQRVYVKLPGQKKKTFGSFQGAVACSALDTKVIERQFREELLKYAKGVVEEYNAWLSGDCWGVCVEVFGADGDQVSEDACWGFIGEKYAREELEAQVEGCLGCKNDQTP